MMKIPKQIKVGGHVIKVRFDEGLLLKSECQGKFSPLNQEIIIDPKARSIGVTFIQEILEALDTTYDLDMPHHTISVLGEGIYQVFNDNNFLK